MEQLSCICEHCLGISEYSSPSFGPPRGHIHYLFPGGGRFWCVGEVEKLKILAWCYICTKAELTDLVIPTWMANNRKCLKCQYQCYERRYQCLCISKRGALFFIRMTTPTFPLSNPKCHIYLFCIKQSFNHVKAPNVVRSWASKITFSIIFLKLSTPRKCRGVPLWLRILKRKSPERKGFWQKK